MRKIGVHVSIADGIYKVFERAHELKINVVQIFLKNANRWKSGHYKEDDINKFKSERKKYNNMPVYAHSGYLINLAGEGDNLKKSIDLLEDELTRADLLGIEYLVIHPGNHKGIGENKGIDRIAESIDRVYESAGINNTRILLETTAGQGTSIGSGFGQLKKIIDKSKNSKKLKVCLDTCHVFAAGYNISTKVGYNDMIREFDEIIGLENLKLIHLNDSKKDCGSRVDRHENIGEGFIGKTGFEILLNDNMLKDVPLILETPKINDESDRKNLEMVKKLIN